MNQPIPKGASLVTVMITVYNGKQYIDRAIRSVLVQTYPEIEIILVDDASSDGTADYVEKNYAGSVGVIRNGVNLGPSGSRNRAIESARGEWVMQLDGDDWIAPERVQRLLDVAQKFRADVVADDQLLVLDVTDRPIGSRFIDNGISCGDPRLLRVEEFVHRDLGSLKPLIRREILINSGVRYPLDIRYGEDFVFLYELFRVGVRFALVPEQLYFLRRGNTGSLTTKRDLLFSQILDVNETLHGQAVARGESHLAAALDLRRSRLQGLRDAEYALKKIRGGEAVVLSEIYSLSKKLLHSMTAKWRLAVMLLSQGRDIRRRMSAID